MAVKFKHGVVIAADNLGMVDSRLKSKNVSLTIAASYGSLARFTDVKRLHVFENTSVVGFGGDISDMQYVTRLLDSLDIEQNYSSYSDVLNAKNLHTYLSKVMYKRRTDFNPLWNHMLVAGLDGVGQPFLSSVDLLGTTYSAPALATGFGSYLAVPILRRLFPDERPLESITKEDAVDAIKQCMQVLFYRDARSLDKFSLAVVTKDGVDMKEDEHLEVQSWAFAESIKGYGRQVD